MGSSTLGTGEVGLRLFDPSEAAASDLGRSLRLQEWGFRVLPRERVGDRQRADGDVAAGPRCACVQKGCGVPCCKRRKRGKELY